MIEAVAQLAQGLELLADLPAGDQRDHLELDVQVALGGAIAATKGFAALEVGRAYERARELCRQRHDHPELPAVLSGLTVHHLHRSGVNVGSDVAEELLRVAEQRRDPAACAVGHRVLAVGALHRASRAAAYADLVPAEALAGPSAAALGEWWAERWTWERDTHLCTVAVDGDDLVGFTYVGPSETPGAAELYGIHVAPDRVGTGTGRLLMASALGQLRGLGEPRAVLWVLAGNARARRFYERGGWGQDGGIRREPIGTAVTTQLRYAKELVGST